MWDHKITTPHSDCSPDIPYECSVLCMLSSILELTTTTLGCICSSTRRRGEADCKRLNYKISKCDIFSPIFYTSDAVVTKPVRMILRGLQYTAGTSPRCKQTNHEKYTCKLGFSLNIVTPVDILLGSLEKAALLDYSFHMQKICIGTAWSSTALFCPDPPLFNRPKSSLSALSGMICRWAVSTR